MNWTAVKISGKSDIIRCVTLDNAAVSQALLSNIQHTVALGATQHPAVFVALGATIQKRRKLFFSMHF